MPDLPQFAALAALLTALFGSLASVYLSVGMKLKACPLCLYQRSFIFAVFSILFLGRLLNEQLMPMLALLALPLGLAGMFIAGFHESLVVRRVLECPKGLLGLGSAPRQSLFVFALLVFFLGAAAVPELWASTFKDSTWFACVLAVTAGLGVLLAWLSLWSSPPLPPVPTAPYTIPLDICRPPFRPTTAAR